MAGPATRRVAFVADELLGYAGNGIGTTTTFVSIALARRGYEVEVFFAGDAPERTPDAEWQRLYDDAGVRVRVVQRSTEPVEPAYFARGRDVEAALRADPPDVVIVQDLGAPAYTAIRLRSLGLAFERTPFVVFCHGTRQWITDISGKVRVLPGALGVSTLERMSVELADAVVSPSEYLVGWMRNQGWRLPERTFVIPHVSRAGATGSALSPVPEQPGRVERLVFFGRLEERKGVRPFAEALHALEPELLERVDVEFLGRPTPAWTVERVRGLLPDGMTVEFETGLDQHEALERLRRPGTLAVMPSFAENSPNTVYECIENGIPFLASTADGIRELVAVEDRERVLCAPTPAGIAAGLRRALTQPDALRPARRAYDDAESLERWDEVLTSSQRQQIAGGDIDCVFLPQDLDEGVRDKLLRAQRATGADVVTCGLSVDGVAYLFPGEPRALALLGNGFGTAGLVRRSLLDAEPAWPLFARLSAGGAKIVSIPLPLVRSRERPATLETHPEQARLVQDALEAALPASARLSAELVTRMAAGQQTAAPLRRRSFARRAVGRLLAGRRR